MKIGNRLLYAFGIMALTIAAIGVAGAGLTFRNAARVASTLGRSFQAITVLESLGEQARQYNVLASSYATAGVVTEADSIRLEQVEGGLDASQMALRTVDEATAQRVQALVAEDVERTRSALREMVAAIRRAGGAGQAVAAAGRLATAQLATVHEKTVTGLSEVRYAQQELVTARIEQSTSDARLLIAVLAVVAACACAGMAVLFLGVRRQIVRPLRALAEGARRISAERDLTLAVPVSGDVEVQDLGRAFAELMSTLREITVEMRGATDRLLSSADQLGGITRAQGQGVSRQASALEEARRTFEALAVASHEAASQADGVLQVAQHAEQLGRDGEVTMQENLASADVIRDQARQAVERIGRLATSAERIAAITRTVKDLADESNILALNAAMEAARAGEAGRGFAVVAREIRLLADRSIQATREVRAVLAEVLTGIHESVVLVEAADKGMEEGSLRTRRLGEGVAGLAGIVRENLGAVREIAAAVASQGAGITQISTAVDDLAQMMQETVRSVDATDAAAGVLRDVSVRVSESVKVFRV